MALPTLRRRSALTASAARLGDREDAYAKRSKMPWQKRVLEYVDLIPELDYTSHFYERMMILLDIYPALRDDKGQLTKITEGPPVALLDRIQDPSGGRSSIQGNYGRLSFITGEGCLFGRDLETDDERWLFVWNDELDEERNSDGSIRKITWMPTGQDSKKEYTAGQAVVYRMWTPHPRRSGEADSPMRACQEIAEELIILTKSVRATAVSRMAKGIFLLPSEISPGDADTEGDEDIQNDPFFQDMVNHFSAQVENAGSAEANAPFIAHAAYDYIDRVRKIELHDPQTDFAERELRSEAINRLAYGLDMPPEVLRGLGSTNHWAAMQILSDMWRSHGVRVGERWCDDLNDVYLRPALRELGYENWKKVVIAYDDSRIVDRRELADPAADRGYIGGKGYRALTGISDDYAPTPKEHAEWIAIKTRGQGLRPATPAQPVGDMQPGPSNPGRDGPAPPGPQGDSGRRTRIVASAARELGAAEMALMRCRELAGARLMQRRHQRDCPECLEAAKDVPLSLAASAVGQEALKTLGLDTFSLVSGGADTLRPLLASWGYTDTQVHELVTVIEVYAASTLCDPETPSLPLAFMAQIEHMKDGNVLTEEMS